MDRAAELLRRQADGANRAFLFALDGVDAEAWAFQPTKGVPSIGWRVRHVVAVLQLYVDHGWHGGGPGFLEFSEGLRARSVTEVIGLVPDAHARFLAVTEQLSDDDLDEVRPTHWGRPLPAWQLVWTVISEQLHHGAEIGLLMDSRRGGTKDAPFPEMQDGRPLA